MSNQFCGNCFYGRKRMVVRSFAVSGRSREGLACVYDAPQVYGNGDATWPAVQFEDWCGRWSSDGVVVHGLQPSEAEKLAALNAPKPPPGGVDEPA